jgi:hypothetical protein
VAIRGPSLLLLAALAGRDYYLEIPGGMPACCNPVSAPVDCSPEALENE